MSERKYADRFYREKLPDGVPCSHPGCLHHASHPCEGCGRIGGITPPTRAELAECLREMLNATEWQRKADQNAAWGEALDTDVYDEESAKYQAKADEARDKARALLERMKGLQKR